MQFVHTMTPLRLGLLGGGSDLPSHYRQSGGCVLSFAIDQQVHVVVKRHHPIFDERFRLSYSSTEIRDSVGEIQNEVIRGCFTLLDWHEPVHISTLADLPAKSGLGSSSAFTVGLLNALISLRGDILAPVELAELACQVELDVLGKPIGKQDQYAAAFGGLNAFEFCQDDSVSVTPITVTKTIGSALESMVIIWTGLERNAEAVLADQDNRAASNRDGLSEMAEDARGMASDLRRGLVDREYVASALNSNWKRKSSLSQKVETPELTEMIGRARAAGADGIKVSGAGGGGFMLATAPSGVVADLFREFGEQNVLKPRIALRGSVIVGSG